MGRAGQKTRTLPEAIRDEKEPHYNPPFPRIAKMNFRERYFAADIPDEWHGTLRGYTEGKCRCYNCTVARSTHSRRYEKKDSVTKGKRVDATGTKRRLQGLVWMGHTVTEVAKRGDLDHAALSKVVVGTSVRVNVEVAMKVALIYRALVNEPPNEHEGHTKRNRRRALELGYVNPFRWEDIDDPSCVPDPEGSEYPYDLSPAPRRRGKGTW